MPASQITHLECSNCGEEFDHHDAHRTCTGCGKVLFARYDLERAAETMTKESLVGRRSDMWRYRELMPVIDDANIITLGEGYTPIFHAKRLGGTIGLTDLLIKDEGLNPTGSFKARGLSAAVSKAKEVGKTALTMPSAGNAAGAMSAYAAVAGMEANVFMPRDAPMANQMECIAYGARLELVDGFITDAGVESSSRASSSTSSSSGPAKTSTQTTSLNSFATSSGGFANAKALTTPSSSNPSWPSSSSPTSPTTA